MADVSSRLRAARERAGLAIEDISASTKIKVSQLQALERGEFERLPGDFFTRAFLRTYAREVGLPPEEIVREYAMRGVSEGQIETAGVGAVAVTAPAVREVAIREPRARDDSASMLRALSPQRTVPAVALATLVLLVLVLVNRQPQRAAEPGAVQTTGAAEPAARPAPTSGTPQPAPDKLSIEIAPTAEIWINASADGRRAVYRLVRPGERVTVEARNELSFRIGNAGAFEYSINGVQGRPLGRSGEVLEFKVTLDNVRTYHR